MRTRLKKNLKYSLKSEKLVFNKELQTICAINRFSDWNCLLNNKTICCKIDPISSKTKRHTIKHVGWRIKFCLCSLTSHNIIITKRIFSLPAYKSNGACKVICFSKSLKPTIGRFFDSIFWLDIDQINFLWVFDV